MEQGHTNAIFQTHFKKSDNYFKKYAHFTYFISFVVVVVVA